MRNLSRRRRSDDEPVQLSFDFDEPEELLTKKRIASMTDDELADMLRAGTDRYDEDEIDLIVEEIDKREAA